MSDLGRKDFSTKASEKMTPDSSKSTVDKVTESITNTGDSVSRNTVPGEQKSTSQKAADASFTTVKSLQASLSIRLSDSNDNPNSQGSVRYHMSKTCR
ncbi:hypothetical protein LTR56_013732 [Elasticomyces elasticus]|nr:hypothetical protein LTR56_013732 [Elasticomyces elasticus]